MTDEPAGTSAPRLPPLRADPGEVDVLVIGSYFCDLVYSGLPGLPTLGEEVWATRCSILPGGTYITAAALHRLGVSCAWSTRFGADPFSRFVLESARREGLVEAAFTHVDVPLPNISVSLSVGSDRSFVSYAEPTAPLAIEAIARLRPRVVIRPGFGQLDDMVACAAAAHAVGALMFVDPQSTSQTIASPAVSGLLQAVDIFAPNEREARLLAGGVDTGTAVGALRASTRFLLVKLGAEGALATDERGTLTSSAFPTTPIETTGAGDCFNAGFLMAMLDGRPVGECLAAGNAAGSLSTRAPSSEGMPTRLEVEALLEGRPGRAAASPNPAPPSAAGPAPRGVTGRASS